MNDGSVVSSAGILLPELLPRGELFLEQLMRGFIGASYSSKGAKELLQSASPSRARTDGSNSRLIAVEGSLFKKDLHTEEINRFAKEEGWTKPSFEDALRLFTVMSFRSFATNVNSVVVLHEPVGEYVLGINYEKGKLILSSYKVSPRKKGWYCKNTAFVFRSE